MNFGEGGQEQSLEQERVREGPLGLGKLWCQVSVSEGRGHRRAKAASGACWELPQRLWFQPSPSSTREISGAQLREGDFLLGEC